MVREFTKIGLLRFGTLNDYRKDDHKMGNADSTTGEIVLNIYIFTIQTLKK